ncbi:MAG: lipid-A-disaccharide synthase [Chitinophagales bacterium]|nr:lipid-A-disaccharide synthase [Hyphomicrobiales bacterium]
MMKQRSRHIFVVAGEHSGDLLGAKLMSAMRARSQTPLIFSGVGGEYMEAEGLKSIFPMSDVAVMGPAAILARLPKLVRRVYQTVDAARAIHPDLAVMIDSPEFTFPIAKRIRRTMPDVPIVNYVSPTVWAWRPGRARKMKPYVDHLLALLPFEPDAHARLGGPVCSYVGHPMIEKQPWIDSLDPRELHLKLGLAAGRPVVCVLPGSRPNEVRHLMQPFGEAIERLSQRVGPLEVIIPAVPSVKPMIEAALKQWPVRPHLVSGEEDKFKAFRLADASLAASGTVTLELAMAGAPMVVAYRVGPLTAKLRFLLNVSSIVLANHVLAENVFPELIQEECEPERLSATLAPLLNDTPERRRQLAALSSIRAKMLLENATPSDRAAEITLGAMGANILPARTAAPVLKKAS